MCMQFSFILQDKEAIVNYMLHNAYNNGKKLKCCNMCHEYKILMCVYIANKWDVIK